MLPGQMAQMPMSVIVATTCAESKFSKSRSFQEEPFRRSFTYFFFRKNRSLFSLILSQQQLGTEHWNGDDCAVVWSFFGLKME